MTKGKIYLVSLGPGAPEHMSLRARQAIAEAEVVIGYGTYIKLIQDLLTGKEVIRKGMTEEIDRCVEAQGQAKLGRRVALISSGDIGVYGMAGPAYEVLLGSGWRPGGDIEVELVPGSTALSACAALVGAPLTHDFCSISLSDLLTPWPLIARRLEAAGRGDFVIALYNPRSGRRTQHLVEAQRILLRHRKPETPVAIVKSAYREGQEIQLVRLDGMADCEIGMLSTVLIGNASSYIREGLMVTPRGYADKYPGMAGDPRVGERAGRSLSLGLEGWKACVRDQLRRTQGESLGTVARRFEAPIGEILQAIGEAGEGDAAGDLVAAPVRAGAAIHAWEAARAWGPVRIEIENEAGGTAEWVLDRLESAWKDGWFLIEAPSLRARIDASRIARAWFLRQGDSRREIHFLDASGKAILTLALVRQEFGLDPLAEQGFSRAWQGLTESAA